MANSSASRPGAANSAGGGGKLAQFKLVLLGESAVGKSSLVLRFVKGQFHEFQVSFIATILLEICLWCIMNWQKEPSGVFTLGHWNVWGSFLTYDSFWLLGMPEWIS